MENEINKQQQQINKEIVKCETQLKEASHINTTKENIVFNYSHKDLIGFDEDLKKPIYTEVVKKAIETTKEQRDEKALNDVGFIYDKIDESILNAINPEVRGLFKVRIARKTKSLFNPFKE